MLAFVLGLMAGAASPTQASVNARIRQELRSAYLTTLINFVCSGLIVALIVLVLDRNLSIPFGNIAQQPFWIWLGGPCGTAIVFLNIICLPHLGSARNVMLMCFGQIMTGLIIDDYGLFGALQTSMSLKRAIGAVLVIAGIALVNGITLPVRRMGQDAAADTEHKNRGARQFLYVILAVICGYFCAVQVAINGTLKNYSGTPFKATLVSMTAGLIATAILTILVIAVRGIKGIYDDPGPVPFVFRPWMVLGAVTSIVIVGGNIVAAPVLGTGVVTILNLIGMMGVGLVIDAIGFLGIEKKPVTAPKIAGMLLMLAGAVMITF